MNQRAFNLFTALVAFVMIMLTVILTNSMTQTEDKAISTLSDLGLQSEIQAVADLARGDSLQVVVYHIRQEIESYLTREGNFFPLLPNQDWDTVVGNFVSTNFADPGKSQQFAFELSRRMSGILATGSSFGVYTLALKQDEASFRTALNKSIENLVDPDLNPNGQRFFEPIGCTTTGNETLCDPGTFYVNIDLSEGAFFPECKNGDVDACRLDNQMFESLPKVLVTRIGSSQALETAILPRSKIKIFVPLRIFKMVSFAKKVADEKIYGDDGFRETVKKLKLGLCDNSNCNVRQGNPLNPPSPVSWEGHACPFSPGGIGNQNATVPLEQIPGFFSGRISYKPGQLTGDAQSVAVATRKILESFYCGSESESRKKYFTANNPFNSNPVECLLDSVEFSDGERDILLELHGSQSNTRTTCQQPRTITIDLKFKENNELYRVNKNITLPYTVRIVDGYQTADFSLSACKTECLDPLCQSQFNCVQEVVHKVF